MNGFIADCRHGLRLHARTPGTSLIAVTVLAVGVAFVVAFLSLYVDLVLRPPPGFEQSGRIATIGGRLPHAVVDHMAGEMTSLDAVAQVHRTGALIDSDAEVSIIALASTDFFPGLRPRLALGRGFLGEEHEPDAEPVAVLSYGFWQERFGGDPGVLDTSITIARNPNERYVVRETGFGITDPDLERDSAEYRIVGIFAQTVPSTSTLDAAVWVPLEQGFPLFVGESEALPRFAAFTLVRRPAGFSVPAVMNEFNARYSGDGRPADLPESYSIDMLDGIVPSFTAQRAAKRQLELFLIGSLLIALVAAINVSLFLLSRAPGRRREIGIRLAAGAPMRRIVQQLATESGLFVVVSAALGVLISLWLATAFRGLPLIREAGWIEAEVLDWRVLGLATAVVLVLALLVSLAPIVSVSRIGIAESSKLAAARASLAQRLAISAQIAVAGTLGGAAIAFGWYLAPMMFGDPGYDMVNRHFVQQAGYIRRDAEPEEAHVVLARRREFIEAIPGVTRVAFGDPVPGDGDDSRARHPVTGELGVEFEYREGLLSRDFVELLGLRMVHGRPPDENESGVVVINQALARGYWGRDEVVGERLPSYGRGGAEVIGVLEDVSINHPSEPTFPYVFEYHWGHISLDAVVESSLTTAELQQAIDGLIADGAIEVPWPSLPVRSLREMRNEQIAADRARGVLSIAAAVLVVGLAAFGLYGTERYLVVAGRREYAIRAALGAGPRALGRLVVRRGLTLGLPGLLAGGFLAFIAVAWVRSDFLSQDISPAVVTIWSIVGLIVLLLAASLSPAREARQTQPAPMLRDS